MTVFYRLLLVFFLIPVFCVSQSTFQKTFGGEYNNYSNSIIKLPDNNSLFIVNQNYLSVGNVGLIKINDNGDTLWTKEYSSATHDFNGVGVKITTDTGFVMAGNAYPRAGGVTEIFIIRLNSAGDTLWTRKYRGYLNSNFYSVDLFNDNSMVIYGITDTAGFASYNRHFLFKVDAVGNIQWAKVFRGISSDGGDVSKTPDGGCILAASYRNPIFYQSEILLVKIDFSGAIEWSKFYGSQLDLETACSVLAEENGTYSVSGKSYSYDTISPGVQVFFKVNNSGNILFAKAYSSGDENQFRDHVKTTDGGYIFAGYTRLSIPDDDNLFLIKTDSMGNMIWSKAYGGNDDDYGNSVQQNADGGFVVSGNTKSFGTGNYEIYLVKTDSLGNTPCNEISVTTNDYDINMYDSIYNFYIVDSSVMSYLPVSKSSGMQMDNLCTAMEVNGIIKTKDQLLVYPNPSLGKFYFNGLKSENTIEIYDITGRAIYKELSGNNIYSIDLSDKDKGIYIYRITNNKNESQTGKIVLQ